MLRQVISRELFARGGDLCPNPHSKHLAGPEVVWDDNYIVLAQESLPITDTFCVVLNIDDVSKLDRKFLHLGPVLMVGQPSERASKQE